MTYEERIEIIKAECKECQLNYEHRGCRFCVNLTLIEELRKAAAEEKRGNND